MHYELFNMREIFSGQLLYGGLFGHYSIRARQNNGSKQSRVCLGRLASVSVPGRRQAMSTPPTSSAEPNLFLSSSPFTAPAQTYDTIHLLPYTPS